MLPQEVALSEVACFTPSGSPEEKPQCQLGRDRIQQAQLPGPASAPVTVPLASNQKMTSERMAVGKCLNFRDQNYAISGH